MKIISIIPAKRGYSAIMDEYQRTFIISDKIIKKENITIGEIDDQKFNELYDKYRKKLVVSTILKRLKYKSYSETQLVQYLKEKKFNQDEIDYGINLLKEKRIINDDRLIESTISYYKENHLYSRYFILQKLILTFGKEKTDIIKEKLNKLYPESDEVDIAYQLLIKKKLKSKDKCLMFIKSRGFPYSAFTEAYNKYSENL